MNFQRNFDAASKIFLKHLKKQRMKVKESYAKKEEEKSLHALEEQCIK